jgi:hypothetical protein
MASGAYLTAYSIKCGISAVATLTLALASALVFTRPSDFVLPFAAYFVFDSLYDATIDAWFQPSRRNFELVILAHHILYRIQNRAGNCFSSAAAVNFNLELETPTQSYNGMPDLATWTPTRRSHQTASRSQARAVG